MEGRPHPWAKLHSLVTDDPQPNSGCDGEDHCHCHNRTIFHWHRDHAVYHEASLTATLAGLHERRKRQLHLTVTKARDSHSFDELEATGGRRQRGLRASHHRHWSRSNAQNVAASTAAHSSSTIFINHLQKSRGTQVSTQGPILLGITSSGRANGSRHHHPRIDNDPPHRISNPGVQHN